MNEVIIKHIKEKILIGQDDVSLLPEDDLLENGLIDSIGVMRLINFIETEYELKIPPQDMTIENFISVRAISDYIQKVKSH